MADTKWLDPVGWTLADWEDDPVDDGVEDGERLGGSERGQAAEDTADARQDRA